MNLILHLPAGWRQALNLSPNWSNKRWPWRRWPCFALPKPGEWACCKLLIDEPHRKRQWRAECAIHHAAGRAWTGTIRLCGYSVFLPARWADHLFQSRPAHDAFHADRRQRALTRRNAACSPKRHGWLHYRPAVVGWRTAPACHRQPDGRQGLSRSRPMRWLYSPVPASPSRAKSALQKRCPIAGHGDQRAVRALRRPSARSAGF